MNFKNLILPVIGEGGLILTVAAVGFVMRSPLIFASLGPTAYELVEKPNVPSARTYNILVGHMSGLAAGFGSLWILGAWNAPKVASASFVSLPRLEAAVVSVVITTLVTLALKASQPASLSTTLLVSLGAMQTARDAISIVLGVVLITCMGQPVRRAFLRAGVHAQGELAPHS